jgi:hypothetical protein
MWPKRAHVLAPLTSLTSKNLKFQWGPEHQAAFERMKTLVAKDVMLRFPDGSKPFHVYTDASNYQLGAVIKQEGKPIAYFSRKLTPTQRRYTTIEKELLSIIETLREYKSILYGRQITVHTDHSNITQNNILNRYTSDRVL